MAAALGPLPERAPPPSDLGLSDTTSASSEVAAARSSLPLRRIETLDQTGAFPPLPSLSTKHSLPSPRSGRSQSLAHSPGGTGAPIIKRKPLSSTASPLATRYSTRDYLDIGRQFPLPEQRFSRSFSVDSPTLYEFPEHRSLPAVGSLHALDSPASPEPSQPSSPVSEYSVQFQFPADKTEELSLRNITGSNIRGSHPAAAQTTHTPLQDEDLSAELPTSLTTQEPSRNALESVEKVDSQESDDKDNTNTNTMSAFVRKSPPPHLTLPQVDTSLQVPSATGHAVEQHDHLNKPLPKSPASSKHNTYFGWTTSPSSTEFSDNGYSPLPSPLSLKPTLLSTSDASPASPKSSQFSNAADESPLDYCEAYLQTPPAGTVSSSPGQIEEMEDELKAISAELAASIRREMDLDDLVDRLQEQVNNPQAPGKRTSDYFSDSGYSSAKFGEYDQTKEEIAQILRRAEQEKAKIRLELTDKLQDERARRRQLDQQVQELSRRASEIDLAQVNSRDASGRVKELETMCEELRRKLAEERQVKDNFEDLVSAMKGELQSAANERDNLRDEIVPQLRARVEGLEMEAAENARMAYDASKLQHELESLKSQNSELKQTGTRMSMALSRSASVAGASFQNRSRPQSLSRSNTVKPTEPREVLAERLKDVEAQRDALHSALKSLLERQELQDRENAKRIKLLEIERDRLLSASPKKVGYEREVSILRDEISVLRRRAEEAIEQKWQVEKGLGGLKMDLDRAEAEIASLRSLLKEKDILIPETLARSSTSSEQPVVPVTSASLEKAYQDLQDAYAEALERIKSLEDSTTSDEKTRLAMERLEQSLAAAISERDIARTEASSYRTQVEVLQASEKEHFNAERDLADQLRDSARRVEELAQQVRSQLATNATLRDRLAETIARGEANQQASTQRIAGMQSRLRTLEDQLVAAQTGAEERVARHEEELATLKDAHNVQLQRLRDASGGLRSPRLFPPKSPLSPMFSVRSNSASGGKSPRLSSPPLLTPNGNRPGIRRSTTAPLNDGSTRESLTEQVETLKGRVAELEGALASTDAEMQEVVGRMNTAQIEVMTLQEEREEAVRETRRLQRILEEERVRVFEEKFRTITTEVR
ncbi:hypothetical protein QBC46DRAFT_430831 [Diplogelasinospora grovesii]|uniref:DUF7603 domain-containing protein n=1 Tax=Diplogelasinospora grovesii TaxID=303347 RepID=A0AAN6S6C1_9PEZI|nr:hypothetical protein QBC46DRAFT_430831 [Diplogelasinospora grovesii]